jgi:hypothetical protein
VSAEVNYNPQKNNINLSFEESEKIAKDLMKKSQTNYTEESNTGSLIE